jgi:hypothetical protein
LLECSWEIWEWSTRPHAEETGWAGVVVISRILSVGTLVVGAKSNDVVQQRGCDEFMKIISTIK